VPAWAIPHPTRIAECQLDCQVKELPEKAAKMTRCEIQRLFPASLLRRQE
jgi:hypothetical protein